MKKIVEGIRYDTDPLKSTKIAGSTITVGLPADAFYWTADLYRGLNKGLFFLQGTGKAGTFMCKRKRDGSFVDGNEIKPLETEAAQDWCDMAGMTQAQIEAAFGSAIVDA